MNAALIVLLFLSLPVSAEDGRVATILGNRAGGSGARGLRRGEEKSFVFKEEELNRYLADALRQEAEKRKGREIEIKSASLRFKEGRVVEVSALARLDAGALKALGSEADSLVVQGLKKYLTMDNSMRLELQVSSAKGKVFVKVLQAWIKEVALPASLIQKVLQVVGEHQRPPLDFNRLFALPNGIQRVEILPGELRVKIRGL